MLVNTKTLNFLLSNLSSHIQQSDRGCQTGKPKTARKGLYGHHPNSREIPSSHLAGSPCFQLQQVLLSILPPPYLPIFSARTPQGAHPLLLQYLSYIFCPWAYPTTSFHSIMTWGWKQAALFRSFPTYCWPKSNHWLPLVVFYH